MRKKFERRNGRLGIWECGSDGSNKMNKSCSQQNYIRSNSTTYTYMYNMLVSSSQSHSALKSFLQENRRIMKKENILARVFGIDWFGLVPSTTLTLTQLRDDELNWNAVLLLLLLPLSIQSGPTNNCLAWTNWWREYVYPPFQRTYLYVLYTVNICTYKKKIQIQKWFLSRFNKSSCWLVATSWRQPFISDSCTGI